VSVRAQRAIVSVLLVFTLQIIWARPASNPNPLYKNSHTVHHIIY
jgi:hypothetical protein